MNSLKENDMLLSFALMAALKTEPKVEFFDSPDNDLITWALVDLCAVPIKKTELANPDKVVKKINDFCHLDLKGL